MNPALSCSYTFVIHSSINICIFSAIVPSIFFSGRIQVTSNIRQIKIKNINCNIERKPHFVTCKYSVVLSALPYPRCHCPIKALKMGKRFKKYSSKGVPVSRKTLGYLSFKCNVRHISDRLGWKHYHGNDPGDSSPKTTADI